MPKKVICEAECPACGGIVKFYELGWKICPHCKRAKIELTLSDWEISDWEIIEGKEDD